MREYNYNFRNHNVLRDYLPYWPVVFVAVILGFFSAQVYLRYTRPHYIAGAVVMIKNDDKSADNLIKQAMGDGKSSIDDEVEILKGRTVIERAVELSNAFYELRAYGKVNYNIVERDQIPIEVVFLNPDSIKSCNVKIEFLPHDNEIRVNGSRNYPLRRIVNFEGNRVLFKPKANGNNLISLNGESIKELRLIISSKSQAANKIIKNFTATTSKKNSLVKMELKSDWENGAIISLDAIINAYLIESQEEKRRMSKFTMDFIDARLSFVGLDLDSIERRLEVFKSENNVQMVSDETSRLLGKLQLGDKRTSELELQLLVLEDLEKYVLGKIKNPGMAPYSAGMKENDLNSNFSELLKLEKDYVLAKEINGPKSDAVLLLKKQIEITKTLFLETIRNTRRSLELLKNKADEDYMSSNSSYGRIMKMIPTKERQLINITRQQEIKSSLFIYLLERREEAAISAAGKLSDLRIVQEPISYGQISPKDDVIYGLCILCAVALILLVLFLKSMLNDKVMDKVDIESRTEVPVLAEIIQVEGDSPLVMKDGNRSLIAEQFRGLRTSLGYLSDGFGKSKILVSSSIPGEGKSFVSTNMAISYSLAGKKTILVESDLRKPNISKHFDISKRSGLSVYLSGNCELEEILIPTQFDNLFVIPAGPVPPNPVELMMNGRYEGLIQYLGTNFDHVVIDCPPIGLVTDAEVLGKWVDASIFIIRHQYTPKAAVSKLIENLRTDNKFKNMGVVMNGLKDGISGYGYGYSYGNTYGYRYGYGYGYGYGYRYGYYGNEKNSKLTIWKEAYKIVIVPFMALLGIKSKVK